MKTKNKTAISTLIAVTIAFSILVAFSATASAGTINADGGDLSCVGSGQSDPYAVVYCNIQDAITDAALTGDTINVADGTYTITAAINVNKGVTITGNVANPENVVVQYSPASTTHAIFDMNAADITVQGIKAKDGKNGFLWGRTDTSYTGCTVTNCIVESTSSFAIGEIPAINTTISNNTITTCGDKGIYIRKCHATSSAERAEVTGNTISGCTWPAIQTYDSSYTYIYNNTISSCNDKGINVMNSGATGTTDRVQVIGNTISLCKWPGIQSDGAPYTYVYSNTLTKCNYYGSDGTGNWEYASIHVQDCDTVSGANVIIDSNTVSDGINGIQTWSDNCEITNNSIYDMGLTYANTKTTADGTYYNSGIIIGSNWLTNNFKPTGTTVTCNNIHDNYWGLYVRDYANLSPGDPSVLSVTAECNWWGHASGPSGPDGRTTKKGKEIGKGDAVSANVDWDPWLPQAVGHTPHDPVPPGLRKGK